MVRARGLVAISENDIEKSLIDPRAADGAVQNLSITSRFAPLNVVTNLVTCLVSICSKTVTVSGDIVR